MQGFIKKKRDKMEDTYMPYGTGYRYFTSQVSVLKRFQKPFWDINVENAEIYSRHVLSS